MKTKNRFLPILAIGLPAFFSAQADTFTFQQGLNGYEGSRQAIVQGDIEIVKTENRSNQETMRIVGVPWGGARRSGLLRFDGIFDSPSGIPKSAKLISAKLELYKIGENADPELFAKLKPTERKISIYLMRTPFHELEEDGSYSCFSYRAYGGPGEEYWGKENKITEGPVKDIDYDPTAVGTIPIDPGLNDQWYSVDVTTIMEAWQDGEPNHGFFLSAHTYWIGLWFASTHFPDETLRPRLVVEFEK